MKTEMPETITEITAEDLATIEAGLVAEFDALLDAGSTDVAEMTKIAESVEAVRAEAQRRIDAAEQIAALAEKVRPVVVAEIEEAEPATEAEVDTEAAPVEVAAEIVAEETTTQPDAAEAEEITEERELVTASTNPKALSARAVKAHTPDIDAPAPAGPTVVITAAADVPGFAGGSALDTTALAKAMHAKARTLSNGSGRVPVASIDLGIEHKMTSDLANNIAILEEVTKPSALTASGWCAPSVTLYELFGVDAGDGLIDLPTVQVTRGGLNVPDYLGLGDAEGALWTWTEDSRDEEEEKQCLYIPCPDFTDYRLVAEGLCVTAGNLTDRAFPELTRRLISLAINAHLHRLSAAIINDIANSAVGVTVGAINSTASGSTLNAIDLQVQDYRSQHRMSVNAVLEAVFPLWVKAMIRSDLALRHGAELTNVTDAVVDAHFAARGIRAQFVHDYQPLFGQAARTLWPTTFDFLLFPAGGYVRGDGGTIDLGVVRDSVLNATNDFTAAWTEQLYLVAQVGPDAREVTVGIDVDGCQPIRECATAS
jgi:hypothetical protein